MEWKTAKLIFACDKNDTHLYFIFLMLFFFHLQADALTSTELHAQDPARKLI